VKWIFGVIFAWLVFVLSLAGWWLYFGVTTLSEAASVGMPVELARHQRMLFTEGSVLLFSLLIGGIGLFYFAYRMYKEKSAKEIFFASFTHDLKTALFRLQLDVEKLSQKTKEQEIQNILGHTRKMQLDLENSLDSTVGDEKKLFIETVNLKNFLVELHAQWPEFHIKMTGEDELPVDRKALHSIFKNLLHNSFIHGEADEVSVDLKKQGHRYHLHYHDNGKAFRGNQSTLGHSPHYSHEGSGFGLFIVRQWVSKMGGQVRFSKNNKQALEVVIELPGGTR
jgi:signal transduction histidine kinase